MKIWTILFLFLLSATVAEAGAGMFLPPPDARTFFFEPGAHYEFTWEIHRSDSLITYLGGDLAQYGTLTDPANGTGQRKVSFEFTLPDELSPGEHQFILYAQEQKSISGLGGIARVAGIVRIISLYPEPYIQLSMDTVDVSEGSLGRATLTLKSWSEKTANVYADIEVFDSKNELMTTLQSPLITVQPQETVVQNIDLPTQEFPPGRYHVQATLRGAQDNVVAKSSFRIGTFEITLKKYTDILTLGNVNRFLVTLESNWNGETERVHAEVTLINQTEKTPADTIGKFGSKEFKTFLDATDQQPHMADGFVAIFVDNEWHAEYPIRVNITHELTDSIEERPGFVFELNALTGLYLLLLLLVIINILLLLRRKDSER